MALDKRFKYRQRETQQFYIFKRNKRSDIYYVRFKNGKTISTRRTTYRDACIFAQEFLNTHAEDLKQVKVEVETPTLKLSEVIKNYFVPGSEWNVYDENHGKIIDEKNLRHYHNIAVKLLDYLSDIESPEELTRSRLIQLQEELLKKGNSGKTVNNCMTVLHKIYKQLLDKELIKDDPFTTLRRCSFVKEKRLCFPLEKLKGVFSTLNNKHEVLAFIACSTGMRRGEIERIESGDIYEKNGILLLKVRGTKTVYSVREVPILQETKSAIERFLLEKPTGEDWRNAVLHIGDKIGFDEEYIEENGIKFHSFRKTYKTLLTQANLNTSLVEMLMGHTTQNQMSNDVERIYFVSESADLTKVHNMVLKELRYLI